MKKLIVGTVFAALPFAANAADLYSPPPAAPYYSPAVSSAFNFSGFYLGANAGYLWGDSYIFESVPLGDQSATFSRDGFIGGGQLGYNFQTGPWVLGAEADIQYSDSSGSVGGICAPGTCAADLKWFGTVRARAGYAFDSLLVYATGGWAYGKVDTSAPGISSSETLTGGWAAGGGLEWGFAPNWTARAEYLYMDLGRSDSGAPFNIGGEFKKNNIFRVGVNYLFN